MDNSAVYKSNKQRNALMNTFTLSTFYKSTQCKRAKCNVVPTHEKRIYFTPN